MYVCVCVGEGRGGGGKRGLLCASCEGVSFVESVRYFVPLFFTLFVSPRPCISLSLQDARVFLCGIHPGGLQCNLWRPAPHRGGSILGCESGVNRERGWRRREGGESVSNADKEGRWTSLIITHLCAAAGVTLCHARSASSQRLSRR